MFRFRIILSGYILLKVLFLSIQSLFQRLLFYRQLPFLLIPPLILIDGFMFLPFLLIPLFLFMPFLLFLIIMPFLLFLIIMPFLIIRPFLVFPISPSTFHFIHAVIVYFFCFRSLLRMFRCWLLPPFNHLFCGGCLLFPPLQLYILFHYSIA